MPCKSFNTHKLSLTTENNRDDKAEVPYVYLGATLSQVETETGTKRCLMSSEKYLKAVIDNL